MTIKNSGSLSFTEIRAEFPGDTAPYNLSDYLAGGPFVHINTNGINGPIPTSLPLSFSDFYGTANSSTQTASMLCKTTVAFDTSYSGYEPVSLLTGSTLTPDSFPGAGAGNVVDWYITYPTASPASAILALKRDTNIPQNNLTKVVWEGTTYLFSEATYQDFGSYVTWTWPLGIGIIPTQDQIITVSIEAQD